MRVFFAVPLPAELADAAENLQGRLRSGIGSGVKWTGRRQWHLTLHFLGDVAQDGLSSLREILACAESFSPFRISLAGAGAFPSPERPQVLWAGVEDLSGGLAGMHAAFKSGLEAAGFSVERRPFAAHLTLGRVKAAAAASDASRFLARESAWRTSAASIGRVELFESRLSPQGPEYAVLAAAELAGRL